MKVIHIGDEITISDKFKKKLIVVEVPGKYPTHLAIEFTNDRIEMLNGIKVGDEVEIEYRAESREYKGSWYTTARGLSIELKASPAKDVPQVPKDDLPF